MLRLLSGLLLGLLPCLAASARPTKLGPVYKGAIVTDTASGAVLFQDNADEISPPASMTKLMTYAVLDDAIREGRISLRVMTEVSELSNDNSITLSQSVTASTVNSVTIPSIKTRRAETTAGADPGRVGARRSGQPGGIWLPAPQVQASA